MKKSNLVFIIIVALLVFYIGNRCGDVWFHSSATSVADKLTEVSDNINGFFEEFKIATDVKSLACGGLSVFFFGLGVLLVIYNKKNTMPGIEHGSASWGTSTDIQPYIDKNPQNNIILTQTESLSINTRKTMRNLNVLIIGGSGSGKTRFFAKPNLLQLHTSFVVTDPKGTLLNELGKVFADAGYVIKTFNTVDFGKSMHYNPFTFIQSEADIKVFTDLLITSTKEKGEKAADQFWENSERLLYMALIGYIYFELDETEHNFATLIRMINSMEVREEDETFKNPVDYMFEELELGTVEFCKKYKTEIEPDREIKPPQPEHFALSQYKKYKLAAGKTAKSILISCGVRLSAFDVKEVREMTMHDEMELSTIGDRKTILFIIIDDKVTTFNFLVSMMYSQLFKELCDKADNVYNGRLPIHVRMILDEFANCGQIPNFEKIISVIRSREISVNVIVQNMAQIESLYDKQAGTIVGNCDTTLFLGSGEEKTMKSISERVGKTTIDHRSSSTTKGTQGSYSLQDQILGRELITADEVGRLNNDECILFIRGVKPFRSKKYNLKSHRNYKKTADFKDENYFDILEYNKNKAEKDKKEIEDFNIEDYLIDEKDLETLEINGLFDNE
jgi:type IV secretion system protein VirD4